MHTLNKRRQWLFGFAQVAEFTHVIETLLDEIRAHQRHLDKQGIDLFLESIDCTRQLLEQLQSQQTPDLVEAQRLRLRFEHILNSDEAFKNDDLNTIMVVNCLIQNYLMMKMKKIGKSV